MTVTDGAISVFLWPPALLATLVVLFCASGSGLAWFVLHRALRLDPAVAPYPPFHAAMIGLFALMLSFTASEAWRRNDTAYGALLRESQEMAAILPLLSALSAASPGNAAEARSALQAYLERSIAEEWRIANVASSAAAGEALDRLRSVVATGLVGPSGAGWRVVQDRLDGVQQARTARLVAGGLFGDAVRWAALAALYLTGAFALAAVHLDRRRGVLVAMVVYAVAGSVAMSFVAVTEHPYAGWDAIVPDRLVEILKRLGA